MTSPGQPEYVFIGTNVHNCEARQHTQRYVSAVNYVDFPTNVTLGFRSNFWRVFSSITEYDAEDFEFEWLDCKWRFVSFWVAESENSDISKYLDDATNVFVFFVLKPLVNESGLSVRAMLASRGISEQQAVAGLIECFKGRPFYIFLTLFKHKRNLNGLFTWSTAKARTTIPNIVAVLCFYSFGLLMTWKIARDLTSINISAEQKYFREHLRSALRIRGQIINLERYFSTQNISNDKNITETAREMRQNFALDAKQARFLPLIDAMERQLLTAAQMRADENSRQLNGLVLVIAFIGLPLSAMSMLLAFNPTAAPILADGYKILLRSESLTFLFVSFVFSGFLSVFISRVIVMILREKKS